jgi:hypothetical protein
MKRIFSLILLFFLFSCKEKFNPNEFKGSWIPIDDNKDIISLPVITLKKDSIYVEDLYTFITKGNYKLKNNSISFNFLSDTLKYDFKFNRIDSTISINKIKYGFWEGYSYDLLLKGYQLINLNKENNITVDSLRRFDNGFHLFKDRNDSIKLRLNDKITSDFNLIKGFSQGPIHFDIPISVIYIGKNVKLKDLLKCYFQLYSINKVASMLITDYNLENNLYGGYCDRFFFWEKQIDDFSFNKVERPRLSDNNREKYLHKYSPEIIAINSLDDINKLKGITFESNYLIQVNTDMNIETYISLKEKISEIKKREKIRIRTEFNLFLPN